MTSIEITSIEGARLRSVPTSRCAVSRDLEPCTSLAIYGFEIGGRVVPVCLQDLARAVERKAIAILTAPRVQRVQAVQNDVKANG